MQIGAAGVDVRERARSATSWTRRAARAGGCIGSTIDNVDFHDVVIVAEGMHNESLYNQAANITIKNGGFANCATMDLFFRADLVGAAGVRRLDADEQLLGAPRFRRAVLPLLRRLLGVAGHVRPRGGARQHVPGGGRPPTGRSRTASSPATRRPSTYRA